MDFVLHHVPQPGPQRPLHWDVRHNDQSVQACHRQCVQFFEREGAGSVQALANQFAGEPLGHGLQAAEVPVARQQPAHVEVLDLGDVHELLGKGTQGVERPPVELGVRHQIERLQRDAAIALQVLAQNAHFVVCRGGRCGHDGLRRWDSSGSANPKPEPQGGLLSHSCGVSRRNLIGNAASAKSAATNLDPNADSDRTGGATCPAAPRPGRRAP